MDMAAVLDELAKRRPVFHSEADFQHSLAWQIQLMHPDAQIRLEVPITGLKGRASLDLMVRLGSERIAIELKYFKDRLEIEHEGEVYRLPPTMARDISRHDVCKDVARIEHAVSSGQATRGYVVVLSNDSGFWNDGGRSGIDDAFKIHHGRTISGELRWSDRAGGTVKGRESCIALASEYVLEWFDFGAGFSCKAGTFRGLVIAVEANARRGP